MAPTGGPRDKDAPKILSNPIDSNLNFKGGNIEIEFDEYLKLQDIQKQLQVTPLLKNNPKVSVKKKSLIIELPDSSLSDNTTYNINFGNSIRDLRENNTYDNLNIIFSTGAYFDSLSFSGAIFDAQTGAKDTGISVYLYKASVPDSNLLKEKPMYATKATNGVYIFNSLPNKDFKLVALKDKNSNYTFDAFGEKVAFYEKVISPTKDKNIILYSFIEENKKDTAKTKTALAKSKGSKGKGNEKKSDSILYLVTPRVNINAPFDVNDTLTIQFTDSLKKIDKNKIRLYESDAWDLSATINFNEEKNSIEILPEWKLGADYQLVLLDGFAADSNRQALGDTIRFKTKRAKDYGNAIIVIEKKLLKEHNILSLFRGNTLIKQKSIADTTVNFNQLSPGKYSLQLLYDNNNNGQWDSGNFKERKQAEKSIQLPTPIEIKPNWDNQVIWKEGDKKGKIGGKK